MMALAGVAGVGGGMVIIPLAMLLFRFSSKEAIALATFLIFNTAIVRFVGFSFWNKHPEKKEQGTEIDYNTARVVFPLFLVGSFLGILLYIVFSELIITVCVVLILGFTSI